MLDFSDEVIEILENIEENIKNRNADKESYESKEMFWEEKNKKCDKYGKFHIGGDNFRIQIVRFNRMNKCNHSENGYNNIHPSIPISDDNYGKGREKSSQNRNKSKNKNNNSESNNIRKSFSSMEETNHKEADNSERRISKSDDHLSLKNKPKPFCNLSENDTVFLVKESKISFFHRLKVVGDFGAIDKKNIAENHSDEKFCEENSDIFDIFECSTNDIFQRTRIKNPIQSLIDTEIHIEGTLEILYRILHLICHRRCIIYKTLSFI